VELIPDAVMPLVAKDNLMDLMNGGVNDHPERINNFLNGTRKTP